MLSLALAASLIIAWQPLTPAARRVQWHRRHAGPDAMPVGAAVAAPSRVEVVRAFRRGEVTSCVDCAQAHIVEGLTAAAGPEASRLVPHTSAGSSFGEPGLPPVTASAERFAAPAWTRRSPAGGNGGARCARRGRGR